MAHTRADVVAAALAVLDANGLEFTSMRRVAAALDVQPSALYHHVPNKQTLLALMADEIVRYVSGEHAAELCAALRRALLSVRDGADVVATASAFRLGASALEARLVELVGAGVAGAGAGGVSAGGVGAAGADGADAATSADGARTLLLYTFGQAQATQTQLQAAQLGALPARSAVDSAAGLTDEPESVEALAAELERGFTRGVEIILAGLRGPAG